MEKGDNGMGELTYRGIVEKISFPCVVIVDHGGHKEEEFLSREDRGKLKEYRKTSRDNDVSYVLVSPFLIEDMVFGILKGKYFSTFPPAEEPSNIEEIIQKTNPPYLIFKKSEEGVEFLGKKKDGKELDRCKNMARSKKSFYIFPHRTSSKFLFYRVYDNKVTGHIFTLPWEEGGCSLS